MLNKSKLRAVVDTNLLISAAIVKGSLPDKLIQSWLKDSFILFASYEQLEEIKEVTQREKLKTSSLFTKKITELLENMDLAAEIVEPLPNKELPIHSRDPEDDFILASALGGDVDYLVTGETKDYYC